MKKFIFSMIILFCILGVLSPPAQAQNLDVRFDTPVFPLVFSQAKADTTTATDSSWLAIRAPFNIRVLSIQVVSTVLADTGSAASAGVVHLWKRSAVQGTATSIASATVVAVNTLYYGSPTTTTTAKFTAGQYLQVGAILSTSDKLSGTSVIVWCIRE